MHPIRVLFLLASLFILFRFGLQAQTSTVFRKPEIAIYPFKSTLVTAQAMRTKAGITNKKGAVGNNLANTIRGEVETAFVASQRFKVVERARIDQLVQEMKLEETMSEQQVNKLGQTLGAQFIILGTLTQSVQQANRQPRVGVVGFSQLYAYEVRAVRVSTGEVLAAENFTASGEAQDKTSAAEKALQQIHEQAEAFIARNYPIEYQMIAITHEKGGEARTIEMVGPTKALPAKRQQLEVFQLSEVEAEGRKFTRRTPIGIVKFEQPQGEILVCEVSKGGDKIKTAFDSKSVIILRPKTE